MKPIRRFLVLLMLYPFLTLLPEPLPAQNIRQLAPPNILLDGAHLKFIVSFHSETPLYLYYKPIEIEEFQIRLMTEESADTWTCFVERETLYGQSLVYHIQSEEEGAEHISPQFSYDLSTLNETLPAEEVPPPTPPPSSPFLSIGATLAGDFFLAEGGDGESQVVNKVDINGNFRIFRNITAGDSQIDLDATLSYMKNHQPDDQAVNLQTMVLRFKNRNHLFEMGDMNLNFSEYSAAYLSRRGLQYVFNSDRITLGAFWANSQQKTGFNGLGIPPANGMLMGAHLAINLNQRIILQGIFITGKDDQTSKTLYSSEDAYREGRLITVLGALHVFPGKWSLDGEYASSNFGSSLTEETLEKNSDTAWKAGTTLALGPLNGRFQYQTLGEHFNSVSNLFLQNDREGLMGTLGVSHGSFSLNISYQDQQTFINHPVQPSQRSRNLATQLNWLIANHFSLGGEFALDNLEYDASTGLQTGGEGMKTLRGMVSVGYVAGTNSITFRAGKTEAQTFTSNLDASVALNLRFGTFFSIAPTFSFQRTTNLGDDSQSDILSLFTSGELTFAPEVASITFTGSYSQNKNTFADSDTLLLGANANLFFAKLFNNKVQPSISLRGQFQRGTYNEIQTEHWTLFLHGDLSF
jgi:hypothetical protein